MYILPSLVIVSLFEYIAHRWALHAARTKLGKDHVEHHKFFALDFNKDDEVPAGYDSYWVRGFFGLIWHLPISLPLGYFCSWKFAITLAIVAFFHALFWAWIHNEMHRPQTRWLQRTQYFQFVRNFHKIHHEKSRTNYAFVFAPLWDWIFGTYRKS